MGLSDSEDEEDNENVAIDKVDSWRLNVHVYDKVISVSCGDATQRLKWAAHVGIARWDEENCQGWKRLGIPTAIHLKKKDGEEIEMGAIIKDTVQNGDHIYVDTSLKPNETK